MRDLPPGWATDVAILEHSGSIIEDGGDHIVVRSPHNPAFHWGHCVLVTDENRVDEAGRWVGTFTAAFPLATWVAIGLARMPKDVQAWARQNLELGVDDVLTTSSLPRQTDLPDGYAARQLSGDDDWEQCVVSALAENAATAESEPRSYEAFVRARTRTQRALSERGVAAFFGAFAGGKLVAELGIVCCGRTARYQNVGTDPQHRRRGLASHLLGLAARWAEDHGCRQWVIVTEATNPAGRLYRAVGFELDIATVQAYRPPAH